MGFCGDVGAEADGVHQTRIGMIAAGEHPMHHLPYAVLGVNHKLGMSNASRAR